MLDMYTLGSILKVYMKHSPKHLDAYEQQLLDGWEEVHKKSQLTLWILLALKDGPKHMAEIKSFITKATQGMLDADDKSMYRALRRYNEGQLIDFTLEAGQGGPDRKQYFLTESGYNVLEAFARRQITQIFYRPEIRNLLEHPGHRPPPSTAKTMQPIRTETTPPEKEKGTYGTTLATQDI